jgi:taurine dioxygenase
MVGFTVGPLPGQKDFGAVVSGLSPEALDDPATRQALYDLWIDKGVIVFRGLTGLETQLKLSAIFGEPEEPPLLRGVNQKRTHQIIADVEYDPEDGDIYEIGGELIGGYLPWHFDSAYNAEINRGGVLRPHVLPRRGGRTGFIDQIAAYDWLPEELKAEIEGVKVIYAFATDSTKVKFGEKPQRCIHLSSRMLRAATHPSLQHRAIHPLVYTQAETGRKVLNVSPWHAVGIEGRENDPAGDALLHKVIDLSLRPERAYFHDWQPDDMVLWDNWRMMHCACGVPNGELRKMGRTNIAGDYSLGRWEDPAAASGEAAPATM